MAEGFPIEPGTPAAEMAAKYEADMHDKEVPMQDRIDAANNYRELTCTFDELWLEDEQVRLIWPGHRTSCPIQVLMT